MCLYPKLIRNKKYVANKKNGGVIPTIKDRRVLMVPVGCGKCMECKKQKAREWSVRLQEEIRQDKRGKFVTLSFSDEALEDLGKGIKLEGYALDNELGRLAVRRFLERWRKKHKKSVKHWIVSEIGGKGTERLHLHGLIFTNEPEEIKKHWQYGNAYIGDWVGEDTVNYIVKYIHKTDSKHKEFNSKVLTSAGIGKGYVERPDSENNRYKGDKTKDRYRARNGAITGLPKYYRNKIYSDEEREELWLQMLDKKIRYVNGMKIDISKNDKEYYKALKQERAKNKRLGYGDDEKDWDRIRYESSRRKLGKKKG